VGFMVVAAVGLMGAYLLRRRGKVLQAFLASSAYLYGMLASAAIAVYPYVLPARDPALGLTVQAAATGHTALVIGLYWWIPGVLLACGYFVYLYSTMPAKFSVHDTPDH